MPENKSLFPELPKFISGNVLKLIAIVAMVLDHTAKFVIKPYVLYGISNSTDANVDSYVGSQDSLTSLALAMTGIGRIAFPIFCFLLVEGFVHTKDVKKYIIRLAVFAFISEIPFDLAFSGNVFYWDRQNTIFTLLVGLLVIMGIDNMLTIFENDHVKKYMLSLSITLFGLAAAYFLNCDYSLIGVLTIVAMYIFRGDNLRSSFLGSILLMIGYSDELYAIFSVIPIYFYNGKRGNESKTVKYLFYVFYPLHLIILYFISHFVLGVQ